MTVAASPARPIAWLSPEGEKQTGDQILRTYASPPGTRSSFQRNTLLIGSRGAGKTFLLKHRQGSVHKGALHINLLRSLHYLSRESGLGGRRLEMNETETARLQAKSIALLGASIMFVLAKAEPDLSLTLQSLDPVLPPQLRSTARLSLDTLRNLRQQIRDLALDDWPASIGSSSLYDLVETAADVTEEPLALFLDRAEDVPEAAVRILVDLLDQSMTPLIVISARPSLYQLLPDHFDPTFVAGDHFDIVHLGSRPHSDEWVKFCQLAVSNFLQEADLELGIDALEDWVVYFARDSVRTAIELAQLALATTDEAGRSDRLAEVQAMRTLLLTRVRSHLYPDDPSFSQLLASVHRELDGTRPASALETVYIHTPGDHQPNLLGARPRNRVTTFLERAIRAEAIFYPPPELGAWHPYQLPDTWELAPLLAWTGSELP